MKGLKRRASSNLDNNSYRVPTKQRGVEDSDTDDTISVASSESSVNPKPRPKRLVSRKSSNGNSKPPLPNKQSTMGGVVTAFLGLRSRTIVREVIEEDESPPPEPRKLLSAKRRLAKKSSSTGDMFPSAQVSLQRKFSQTRAATALY